jgi:DNA processing protein
MSRMMNLEIAIAVQCLPTLSFEEKLFAVNCGETARDLIVRLAPNPSYALRSWESYLRWLDVPANRAATLEDACYPPLLREISDPPLVLSMCGAPMTLVPTLSIVGTRTADGPASRAAGELASECALAGIPVVSGFARGIDRHAHEGCLRLGGDTWAVLGCGLGYLGQLGKHLVQPFLANGGLFLSEFHPFAKPLPWRFPVRNRIIAGISAVTVVVQAPLRSGAMITARHALDQGRDVVVHASGLAGELGAGCAALAGDGAPVITSLDDILRRDFL